MIMFTKTDKDGRDVVKVFKEVIPVIKGTATVAQINCDKAKKLCKKLKIQTTSYELKYYKDGTFNKDYDRQLVKKSMINFFNDPSELPWEEEENAKDVIHFRDEISLNKQMKKNKNGMLVMFYAPWCGFCKKLKPDYSVAATELKNEAVMAAMNVDLPEAMSARRGYNITGFPTLLYFRNGELQHPYGGEMTKDSLVSWMKDPQPPKEKEPELSWAEEENVFVKFLTAAEFDSIIAKEKSVLIMFYAPWCGHCKTMKPVYNNVARRLIDEKIDGVIAAVDATKETKLAERFKIKGFPTVKYFKNGKFAWDYSERAEEKIYAFMKDPSQPPPPEPEWKDEASAVVHLEDSNFNSFLKTKKHALVMFYAPWCGHCKNAKPHYTKAAEQFKDDIKVSYVAVDCTKEKLACEQYGVKGFPSIKYFNFGKNPQDYEGGREEKDFIKFMTNPNDPDAGKFDARQDWLDVAGNEHVNFLDDTTFDAFITNHDKVLVMFYAPWCGHCKTMKPAYGDAATEMKKFLPGAYLAAVDSTKSTKVSKELSIQGFPTLKYFENGSFKFDYESGRSKDEIVNFMRDPKQRAKTEL